MDFAGGFHFATPASATDFPGRKTKSNQVDFLFFGYFFLKKGAVKLS